MTDGSGFARRNIKELHFQDPLYKKNPFSCITNWVVKKLLSLQQVRVELGNGKPQNIKLDKIVYWNPFNICRKKLNDVARHLDVNPFVWRYEAMTFYAYKKNFQLLCTFFLTKFILEVLYQL